MGAAPELPSRRAGAAHSLFRSGLPWHRQYCHVRYSVSGGLRWRVQLRPGGARS